jgi:adenosylmethionine-8-amino-7-oxononanoate aminotransferase
LFEDGERLKAVARISQGLGRGLEACRDAPGVSDVRVLGAIGVVEFDKPLDAGALSDRFAEVGVFVRPMGRVIYLTPALIIDDDDLERLTGAVARVAREGARFGLRSLD